MLELRPNCECCDKDLPPESPEARICTYECTFCANCVDTILRDVCPNCGGGFMPRPIRPKTPRRENTSLLNQPASTKRVHSKYSRAEMIEFSNTVKNIQPNAR